MASIYQLKPAFQHLLRPLAHLLARLGVTANHVTLAAFLLSCFVGGIIARYPDRSSLLLLLPGTLLLRMALNAIDGMLAREYGMKTRLGAVLNELGDVLSDAALYLPLALVPGLVPHLMVGFVTLGICAEMTGVIAVQIDASRNYAGPMGKSDRAFLIGFMGLLLGLGITPDSWSTALLGAGTVLAAVTIVNRARHALAEPG